jgi:hypothetical protein
LPWATLRFERNTVSTVNENNDALLAKVARYLADATFERRLSSLLAEQEARVAQERRQAEYADKLVEMGSANAKACAVSLLELARRKNWLFSEREWVPDEFQSMEDHGLVKCFYGSKNSQGLQSRELYVTEHGATVVARIKERLKSPLPCPTGCSPALYHSGFKQ